MTSENYEKVYITTKANVVRFLYYYLICYFMADIGELALKAVEGVFWGS